MWVSAGLSQWRASRHTVSASRAATRPTIPCEIWWSATISSGAARSSGVSVWNGPFWQQRLTQDEALRLAEAIERQASRADG